MNHDVLRSTRVYNPGVEALCPAKKRHEGRLLGCMDEKHPPEHNASERERGHVTVTRR
jgi:hypothetical protein